MRGHGSAHCTCGASITGTSTPPEFIEKIVASFLDEHCGEPGHEPTDARTAAAARRRTENARVDVRMHGPKDQLPTGDA